jgi:ComF family protein
MLRSLFYSIINAIIPPRAHEARVFSLTLDELEPINHSDGLPYHDKRVTALVWELKYRASSHALVLAGAILREKLLEIAEEELGTMLLIPIPMHSERRKERGFNQTELLCEAALKELRGGPVEKFLLALNVLERVRHTAPQQTLARHKRLTNIKNAMRVVDPSKIKGRVCVVIDDVATTGATLREAERALLKAGASGVYPLALARS